VKINELRDFIITFPRWANYSITPPQNIALDKFDTDRTPRLSLVMTGNNITANGEKFFIDGSAAITRQADFSLNLSIGAGGSSARAAVNEFLFDFTGWLDESSVARRVPAFGDEAEAERTWASGGGFLGDAVEGRTSVYKINLHKIYTRNFPMK